MSVQEVTPKEFDRVILSSETPMVVEFVTAVCPWCKRLAPIYEKLSNEYGEKLKFYRTRADLNRDLALRYGIMGVPTLKFFCSGRTIGEVVGFLTEPNLKGELDKIVANHKQCLAQSTPYK